jgi:hypothetical protein
MENEQTMSFGIRLLQPNQMRRSLYGPTFSRDAFYWKCGNNKGKECSIKQYNTSP